MMRLLLSTLIVGFSTFSANAADVSYPVDGDMTIPVEFGSGWYIRGDIGMNINGHRKDGDSTSPADEYFAYETNDSIDISLGFGFRLNESIRLEGSFESTLLSETSDTSTIDRSNCPTMQLLDPDAPRSLGEAKACLETASAEYDATVLMANGYYDLPKMGKFEPYVGAGVGVSRIAWAQEVDAITCVPTDPSVFPEACVVPGLQQPIDGEIVTFGGQKSTGVDYLFSYALTAGTGYRVSDNLIIDAHYRYLSSGPDDIDYSTSGAAHFGSGGFGVHQVRMGLRYELF